MVLDLPLLVTSGTNIRYLTGLDSSNAALLVGPEAATLYTDFRYAESAAVVDGVEFVESERDLFGDLARRLAGRRVGFESAALPYSEWARLAAGGVELEPTFGRVEALRAVKDAAELDALRRAAALSDEVLTALASERFTGRTERELAWLVERTLRERGAEGMAFPVVVAAGPNASRPHAEPGERRVERGELVIVDAGCVVDGYCSDCTRTFAVGDLAADLSDLYALCLRAQLAGLAAVRAGAAGGDVDAAARSVIESGGLGERFGHGLGHGVGVVVHEAPTLRPGSADVLQPGNVVTVEPGIYLPGVAGVRIEDLVVVTDGGHERLTAVPKELTRVE